MSISLSASNPLASSSPRIGVHEPSVVRCLSPTMGLVRAASPVSATSVNCPTGAALDAPAVAAVTAVATFSAALSTVTAAARHRDRSHAVCRERPRGTSDGPESTQSIPAVRACLRRCLTNDRQTRRRSCAGSIFTVFRAEWVALDDVERAERRPIHGPLIPGTVNTIPNRYRAQSAAPVASKYSHQRSAVPGTVRIP